MRLAGRVQFDTHLPHNHKDFSEKFTIGIFIEIYGMAARATIDGVWIKTEIISRPSVTDNNIKTLEVIRLPDARPHTKFP